jgi:hypothetical protein
VTPLNAPCFDDGARPSRGDDACDSQAGIGEQRPQFLFGTHPGFTENHQHAHVQRDSRSRRGASPHEFTNDEQTALRPHHGVACLKDLYRLGIAHAEQGVFEHVRVGANWQIGREVASYNLAAIRNSGCVQNRLCLCDNMRKVEQYPLQVRMSLQDARQKRPTPASDVDKRVQPLLKS